MIVNNCVCIPSFSIHCYKRLLKPARRNVSANSRLRRGRLAVIHVLALKSLWKSLSNADHVSCVGGLGNGDYILWCDRLNNKSYFNYCHVIPTYISYCFRIPPILLYTLKTGPIIFSTLCPVCTNKHKEMCPHCSHSHHSIENAINSGADNEEPIAICKYVNASLYP